MRQQCQQAPEAADDGQRRAKRVSAVEDVLAEGRRHYVVEREDNSQDSADGGGQLEEERVRLIKTLLRSWNWYRNQSLDSHRLTAKERLRRRLSLRFLYNLALKTSDYVALPPSYLPTYFAIILTSVKNCNPPKAFFLAAM